MLKLEEPELKVLEFEVEDILTVSGGDIEDGELGEGLGWGEFLKPNPPCNTSTGGYLI